MHVPKQTSGPSVPLAEVVNDGVISIFLMLALYRLLKDVNREQAALMVILGGVAVAPIFFLNALNRIAALLLIHGGGFLAVFSLAQLDSLAMLFLRLHGALDRILAVDRRLRVRRHHRCGHSPAGLSRTCVSHRAADALGRTCDHAVLIDQGRKRAAVDGEFGPGGWAGSSSSQSNPSQRPVLGRHRLVAGHEGCSARFENICRDRLAHIGPQRGKSNMMDRASAISFGTNNVTAGLDPLSRWQLKVDRH